MSRQRKKDAAPPNRPVIISIERAELKGGAAPLQDRYFSAQFKHFFSESYAQTISTSSSSLVRDDSAYSVMGKSPLCRTRSKSAPVSPKGGIHKSATLPPDATFVEMKDSSGAIKRKKSASISNFFRKISPRLRKNVKDPKPWIVVEFSPSELDVGADKESETNDPSFEMALKNKDFNVTPNVENSPSSKEALYKTTRKRPLAKFSGMFKGQRKELASKKTPELQKEENGTAALKQTVWSKSQEPLQPRNQHRKMQNECLLKVSSKKMESMDSIGDCSLDVEASVGEKTDRRPNGLGMSESTVRSISLDNLDDNRHTRNGACQQRSSNGHTLKICSDVADEEYEASKKPSYLNISCSISGYSDYSHYHPPRYQKSRSRDSSPLPNSAKMLATANYTIGGDFASERDQTDFIGRNKSAADYFAAHHELSVVKELKKSTTYSSSSASFECADNIVQTKRSIVRQRIDKINAQKFDIKQPSNGGNHDSHSSINRVSGSPPVFRHLRKEFRDQLNASSKALKTNQQQAHSNNHHLSSSLPPTSIINGHSAQNSKRDIPLPASSKLLLEMSSRPKASVTAEEKRDGHYFVKVMEDEKIKIEMLLVKPLTELQDDSIPEEAMGKIRSAVGKATLLTTKKFTQFRQLCEKNINQNSDEQFSALSSDLEGFWDMVMLQVSDIYDTFTELDKMRKNSWKEDISSKKNEASKRRKASQSLKGHSKSAPTTPERSAKAAAAARAREEARKKLMAAKKRGRQSNAQSGQNVEIFTP